VTPSFAFLRDQIIGADATLTTPFGQRLMVYGDYTASGRCLLFVENYLQILQRTYANTHTEDDTTGRNMTQLLHEAEAAIKSAVNAGPDGRIIAVGTGDRRHQQAAADCRRIVRRPRARVWPGTARHLGRCPAR
jgi:selenocysteine lyase/cysteine desulfurase